MSDWDFLWECKSDAERMFAMETGMTYSDLEYLEEQEKHKEMQAEKQRVKERNEAWNQLKEQRNAGEISPEEFKKQKAYIFRVENERKRQQKEKIRMIKRLKKMSECNQSLIMDSVKCLCYKCVSIVLTYNLKYDNETAICPHCNQKCILPCNDECCEYIYDIHNYYFPNEEIDSYDI